MRSRVMSLLALSVVLTLAPPGVAKDRKLHASFRVIGLLVNSTVELPATKDDDGEQGAFFGMRKGTTLAILVSGIKGAIIELDEGESKIESFVDASGAKVFERSQFGGPFESTARSSGDKSRLVFRLHTDKLPTKGSDHVKVKGSVALKVSQSLGEAKSKRVSLAAGKSLEAGPFSFKVTRSGKAQFHEGEYEIELESSSDLSGIQAVKFLDSKGEEVATQPSGSSRMMFGSKTISTSSYRMKRALKSGRVEIKYWKNLKTVMVPFDITARVGL